MKLAIYLTEILIPVGLLLLPGCSSLPAISSDIEKIATNDAVTLKIDKDTFGDSTDVHVIIDVINKEVSR